MVNSFVARKDLDTEMTVVRNEFESGENSPQRVLWGRLQAAAFDWHNYGNLTIGARSDIENVDIARLQAFYKLYYQPDNAVLIVAGRFDPDRTLAQIAKTFGPIPTSRAYAAAAVHEGAGAGRRALGHRSPRRRHAVRRPRCTARCPARIRTPSRWRRSGEVMSVEPAGRLYRALVETKKASAVESWNFVLADPGNIIFWAQVPPSDSLAAARDALVATVEGVQGEADHRRRSRSRARQGAAPVRRDVQRPAEARRGDLGVDRDRRLASFLPAARPVAQADAGRRAAGALRNI